MLRPLSLPERRLDPGRQQIAEITEQLGLAEQVLSRLSITKESMTEILGETCEPEAPDPQDELGRASDRARRRSLFGITVADWDHAAAAADVGEGRGGGAVGRLLRDPGGAH